MCMYIYMYTNTANMYTYIHAFACVYISFMLWTVKLDVSQSFDYLGCDLVFLGKRMPEILMRWSFGCAVHLQQLETESRSRRSASKKRPRSLVRVALPPGGSRPMLSDRSPGIGNPSKSLRNDLQNPSQQQLLSNAHLAATGLVCLLVDALRRSLLPFDSKNMARRLSQHRHVIYV